MTKKKKAALQNSSSNFELSINVELDLKALRAKNKKLAQSLATHQQDKSRQQHEMNTLQSDYHKLKSKFLNLQNITTSLDTKMKECLPLLLNVVNMFTQLIHVSNAGAALCNSTPNKSEDTKTQTVKPQIVNGHVLHNPTVNISRLNGNIADSVFSQATQRMSQISQQNQSTSIRQSQDEEQSRTPNSETSDSEEELFQPNQFRGRDAILVNRDSTNDTEIDTADDMASDNEDDDEQSDEEKSNDEEDNCNRLMTVLEEDEETTQNSRPQDKWRDVRVVLSQLPKESNTKENQTLLTSQSVTNESKSSLICQTNNSVLENEALLDDMMSMTYGTSRDASGWSSAGQSPIQRVCMVRGGSGPKPGNSSTNLDSTLCLTTNERTLQRSGNKQNSMPTINNTEPNGDNSEKMDCMRRLGLEPNLMTSTPVIQQCPRTRSTKGSVELLDTSQSPVSKVTKKRGSGSGNKNSLAKVVLQRVSLQKKLSGSPIKKIGDVLDIVPITRSSDIKRNTKRKPRRKIDSSDSDDICNGKNIGDTKVVVKIEKMDTQKMSKGKENEDHSSPNSIVKRPRLKRAARPSQPLVEPSLIRKMRRSK